MDQADDTRTKVQKNEHVGVISSIGRDIDHGVVRQLTSSPLPFSLLKIILRGKKGSRSKKVRD